MRLLLLEDDRLFCQTLQDFLEEEGFCVDACYDPKSALDLTYEKRYDLYIFDINLPFEDGISLLRSLRQSDDVTPALFITSNQSKSSLIAGFKSGADDYLKKPIDLDELSVRIDAVLKRGKKRRKVELDGYLYDRDARALYNKEGKELWLSTKAKDLLELLIDAKGALVTTEHIANRLYSYAQEPSFGAIRVYITQLKRYLKEHIVNERGVGYRLKLKR